MIGQTGWNRYVLAGGAIEQSDDTLRLINCDAAAGQLCEAQIDDYQGLPRRRFLHRPPLTLTVQARFSHPAGQLCGTAGWGFWNDPFMMTGRRLPTLPRAIWFFYASPPSDMRLALDVPGCGWKAATIDALRPSFFLLLPTAPLAVPLMNIRSLYRCLWPLGQQAIGVREAMVGADMTGWHTYRIEWNVASARFFLDNQAILESNTSPDGPLGFVMWLDNQYMAVTPWGAFRYGLLASPGRQWLKVQELRIEPGNSSRTDAV